MTFYILGGGSISATTKNKRREQREELVASIQGAITNVRFDSQRFLSSSLPMLLPLLLHTGIFGQKLEDTVRYEKRYGNHLAPLLVEQCVDFIRLRGLKEEGLFRLPGQANLVKELQDAFDCGEKPLFDR